MNKMPRITNIIELNEAICELEIKQAKEVLLLKEQFKLTYESLSPANLLRNTFKDLVNSPALTTDIVTGVLNFAARYIYKKSAEKATSAPVKQILVSGLQMVLVQLVSKNLPGIKKAVTLLINNHFMNKEVTPK
jgi:hypothetical protein